MTYSEHREEALVGELVTPSQSRTCPTALGLLKSVAVPLIRAHTLMALLLRWERREGRGLGSREKEDEYDCGNLRRSGSTNCMSALTDSKKELKQGKANRWNSRFESLILPVQMGI